MKEARLSGSASNELLQKTLGTLEENLLFTKNNAHFQMSSRGYASFHRNNCSSWIQELAQRDFRDDPSFQTMASTHKIDEGFAKNTRTTALPVVERGTFYKYLRQWVVWKIIPKTNFVRAAEVCCNRLLACVNHLHSLGFQKEKKRSYLGQHDDSIFNSRPYL